MEKPVRTDDDAGLPISAQLVVGGLALFGALALLGWVVNVAFAVLRFVIAAVVILALIAWVAGRRMGR